MSSPVCGHFGCGHRPFGNDRNVSSKGCALARREWGRRAWSHGAGQQGSPHATLARVRSAVAGAPRAGGDVSSLVHPLYRGCDVRLSSFGDDVLDVLSSVLALCREAVMTSAKESQIVRL